MTALLFDCDGVLVDSEPLSVAELGRALRQAGASITDDDIFRRMIGRPVNEIVATIRQEQGFDATPFLPEYRTRLAERFKTELQPVPGIAQALRAIPPWPKAVASSSTPPRLELSLRICGMWDDFAPHIYSATQVPHGKPAPDLFLFAAGKLGVPPQDCIVIEDSPAGIEAARAAGMRVVGLLAGSHAERSDLARNLTRLHPDALLATAEELPDTLQSMSVSA